MHMFNVLLRPIITEKNTLLGEHGKYTFEVDRKANKPQVREAVEKAFKVKVVSVNVCNMPGKLRRVGRSRGLTSPWRKAVVTLQVGQKLELFEGV
ncbi:MAG: 50S ribosomal protein L23 [Dehalococcoidia bacterium]|nr:50S ribosomal protein L23 [Dehalococcoidia bacterium]